MGKVPDPSKLVASAGQVSSDLKGETVVLNLQSGRYHGLDPVGTAIWKLVQEPRTVDEICRSIRAEFDVSAEQCEADVQRFLSELESRGLIERR